MSTVRLTHVSKRFGPTVAVHELDLEVADGELLTLLGPSGCGKTTTLRMIAGLVEPSGGRIEFDDQDVTWLPPALARPAGRPSGGSCSPSSGRG